MLGVLTALFLLTGNVHAQDQDLAVKPQDHLKIILPSAQITYVMQPEAKALRVKDLSRSQNAYVIEKIESGWVLKSSQYDTKPEVFLPAAKIPKVQLEITGPSLNLDFFVREGQIHLAKFKGEVSGFLQKGLLSVKGAQGQIHWMQQRGEIQLTDVQGRVNLDSQTAAIKVKDVRGDLDVKSFSGDSVIEGVQGNIALTLAQGVHKLVQGGGTLQLEVGRSAVQVSGFSGRIEGQGQEGSIFIKSTDEPNISVKTVTTKTTVQVPGECGAQVQLATQDGDIFPPNYLGLVKEGGTRIVKGRLRGSLNRGHISVRTQEGSITLR